MGVNPIQTGGGSKRPAPVQIAFKHEKSEKSKNENAKKRPPQAPTPHQYPGIYRIYEYTFHKASGVQEISKNMCARILLVLSTKKTQKPSPQWVYNQRL